MTRPSIEELGVNIARLQAGLARTSIPVDVTQAIATVTTLTTGNVRTIGLWWTDSTANLAAGAVFTGTARDAGTATALNNSRFVGRTFSDQAGTLFIEQSRDGTVWRGPAGIAVAANEVREFNVTIITRFVRVRYLNGATAQTAFELLSALQGI